MRRAQTHVFGNVLQNDVLEIWNSETYTDLRERVQRFDFSSCTFCSGCELSTDNVEDCLGNTGLVCGGCLWAQGVIRCP